MVKIGLLGLYLELYDIRSPEMRTKIDGFYETIAKEIEKRGMDVCRQPVCRLKNEFQKTIDIFENKEVDAIVTLHLAYSPSLESDEVLKNTKLPIIILNTTPDFKFNVSDNYNAISFNHGIHGVQDMCNLLLRNKKKFRLESGHWEKSDVIDRVCGHLINISEQKSIPVVKVGIIGKPFTGMGDFAVSFDKLKNTLGIDIVECDYSELKKHISSIGENEIDDEIIRNSSLFDVREIPRSIYRTNIRACLGVRKWIEVNKLDAFTVNFMDVDQKTGLPTVPFYEASLQMANRKGYAGEGDILTAALVARLGKITEDVSFTEIFCPDWENDSLFLSHMGEMNINLCSETPVLHEKDYIFSDVKVNPIVFSGEFKPGKAMLVNLAPAAGDSYSLILAPINLYSSDKVNVGIRGWFRSSISISDFLSEYSKLGGTHHSALVYGDCLNEIKGLANIMGWKVEVIQ